MNFKYWLRDFNLSYIKLKQRKRKKNRINQTFDAKRGPITYSSIIEGSDHLRGKKKV